jgi:hypothetical protein
MSIARQRVAKHIPAEANARNNMTSIARQLRGNQAFSTIQDVFSMDKPRYYTSSPVAEREREWDGPSPVKEEGSAED